MRTLAALAVLASLLVLPGCPAGGFGCGAPDDTAAAMVLGREGDTLVLCANDGYAATLDGGARVLEGHYAWQDDLRGTDGATGAEAFSLRWAEDGSLSSDAIGSGWREVVLDEVALHYAGVACTDLETRAWWPAR